MYFTALENLCTLISTVLAGVVTRFVSENVQIGIKLDFKDSYLYVAMPQRTQNDRRAASVNSFILALTSSSSKRKSPIF